MRAPGAGREVEPRRQEPFAPGRILVICIISLRRQMLEASPAQERRSAETRPRRRIEPDIGDDVHRLPVRYSLTGGSPAGAMGAHKGRKRSTRLDGRSTALGRLRSILYRAEIGRSGRFADIRAGFPAPRFCGLQDFAFKVWWESRRCGMISARSRPESR